MFAQGRAYQGYSMLGHQVSWLGLGPHALPSRAAAWLRVTETRGFKQSWMQVYWSIVARENVHGGLAASRYGGTVHDVHGAGRYTSVGLERAHRSGPQLCVRSSG